MKKTSFILLLMLAGVGSRAEPITKTEVSGYPYYVFESKTFERLTKYIEYESATGPNDQQAFLDVQSGWDAEEFLDLGTYSWSYYDDFGWVETPMYYQYSQFSTYKEGREYTFEIDLSDFDPSTCVRARLEWELTARRKSKGSPDIHTALPNETADLSTDLQLGVTNTVVQTVFPRWETWTEWQAGHQEEDWLFWGRSDAGVQPYPKVYAWLLAEDIQPEGVRPQWPLARTRDPINTINGNVSFDTTDIAVPTPGVPLIFARAYNSADDNSGPLGPRWSHSYHWTLGETNTTFDGDETTWKVVRTGEGSEYRFKVDGGAYESPFDLNWQLADAANDGYTLTIPPATEYLFTSNGILASIADGWGNTVSLTYTNGTQLAEAEHSGGLALEFEYTGDKLTSVTSPSANLSMSYAYNADGELTNATRTVLGSSEVTAYGYDASTNHFLVLRQNPNGDQFGYAYETNNGALTSRGVSMTLNTNWYTHALVYSNNWNKTFVTYERGDIDQTFEYDINPLINRVAGIDGPGSSVVIAYDDSGNITNSTTTDDASGDTLVAVMAYDAAHNVTNESVGYGSASAQVWHYTWHTNQTPASVTDPEGNSIEYDYTAAGALSEMREFPAQGVTLTTRYGYTTNGLLAAVTNANGHSVAYDHDPNGYVSEVDPQAGPTVTYSNNVLGHIEKIILPGASGDRVTDFTVDPLGQILEIDYPDNTSESMAYDKLGNMTAHTNAEGSVTTFEYHPARTLSKIVHSGWDGLTITNRFSYDRQFNTLAVVDALGRSVESYALDTQDRPTTITNVEGRTMSIVYGVGEMVKGITRFDGTTVSNVYDSEARLDTVTFPDGTLDYGYYDNGLLKTAANGLGTVSNQYDGANRLTASKATLDGLTANVAYGLDGVGNATNTTVTVDGKTLTASRTFDAAERVSTLSASGELASPLSFAYAYNPYNGLPATVTNNTTGGHVAYAFDEMDRLDSITWKDDQGGTVRSFDYAYSAGGMVTNITLESGARRVYTYDSLQRLESEKHLSATGATLREESYTYDAVGNRKTKVLDGTTVTYSYPYGNQGNRLASWSATSTDQFEAGRLWDIAGYSSETIGTNDRFGVLWVSNTVAVTPEVSGTNFTVDALVVGSGSQQIVAAIRDEAGNMGYATNTVTTRIITNAAYGYSDAGCVTSIVYNGVSYTEKTIGLEWNGQYQLTTVRENGSLVESYGYDALGRRAWISDGSSTNWMVYDGQHLAAEVDSDGDLIRRYVRGPGVDNMLGMVSYADGETNAYFFVVDHLGTVHAVLDEDGDVVESYELDAWGRLLAVRDADGNAIAESAIGNRILFQGREYSAASGLYFHRTRYYDPVVVRWTAPDPIGIAGGENLYVAFNNNGIMFIDPDGLDWFDALASGAAGMGDIISFGITKKIRDHHSWFYGETDTSATSYKVGQALGIAHGVAMGGAGMAKGAARAGAHGMRGTLYEIGQKTMTSGKYKYFVARNADPVRRGIDIVRHQGWLRARTPSLPGILSQGWKTVGTGLTPIAAQGLGEVAAVGYGAAQATYGVSQLYRGHRQGSTQ